MKAIVQEHPEGCALACAAMLTNRNYSEIAGIAGMLDIHAGDKTLYSTTTPLRRLLNQLGVRLISGETAFASWDTLPNKALLATKWHIEEGLAMWHWVVFVGDENGGVVYDPAPYLEHPKRRDLSTIHPKWFIEVLP